MSNLQDIIADTSVKAFNSGYLQGAWDERMRITKALADYFEITQEPDDEGNVTENLEWDRGFQAAMALIKGEQK